MLVYFRHAGKLLAKDLFELVVRVDLMPVLGVVSGDVMFPFTAAVGLARLLAYAGSATKQGYAADERAPGFTKRLKGVE